MWLIFLFFFCFLAYCFRYHSPHPMYQNNRGGWESWDSYTGRDRQVLPRSGGPTIPAAFEAGEAMQTPLSSRRSAAASVRSVSALSGSSSLIARYLAPEDLARAAGAPIQTSVSKAILACKTQSQNDIIQVATTTRDTVTDLVAATKVCLNLFSISFSFILHDNLALPPIEELFSSILQLCFNLNF